jgi:hypothetical protein
VLVVADKIVATITTTTVPGMSCLAFYSGDVYSIAAGSTLDRNVIVALAADDADAPVVQCGVSK